MTAALEGSEFYVYVRPVNDLKNAISNVYIFLHTNLLKYKYFAPVALLVQPSHVI